MAYLIGVDTGGTFTDCVVMDEAGKIHVGKAPSTPQDFSEGILQSVRVTAETLGMTLERLLGQTSLFCHGSTAATNALLTRSGAKTGLITTIGFEDTIFIMRVIGKNAGLGEEKIKRQVKSEKPVPVIPKTLIRGVHERVDYKGEIVTPLDREGARGAVKLLADSGVDAIAVALLWAQANPAHEQEIKRLIKEMYPDIYVTTSSDLVPVLGEYERTATTVINAYLGPLVSRYLQQLEGRLKGAGFQHSPLVAQAHGGSLRVDQAVDQPVSTIHSGPVAGVIGSKYVADLLGYANVITTDMGGTSFDIGLISEGAAEPALETIIDQYHLLVPMIGVTSIGAGGGSIAWVEPVTNRLRVGPSSAGAEPGPVCYDAGGTEPTVTDADLVLGYLNPDYFLGGKMKLNREKAAQAIKTKIADPLGMDLTKAAAGINAIVNAHMADLIRSVTVGRGYDPRRFVLFAYGGAGPVHATAYGKEAMGVIIPVTASVHSAMGALASDIVHPYQVGVPMQAPADVDRFNQVFADLDSRALHDLQRDGFSQEEMTLSRFVDMRYSRQVHGVRTPCPDGKLNAGDLEKVYSTFETLYERLYGKGAAYREAGMQITTFRVEARGSMARPALTKHPMSSSDPSGASKLPREAFFHRGPVIVDIYDFEKLQAGNVVPGPAIIESPITTILIDSDQTGRLDEYLNVIVGPKGIS